MPYNCQWEGCIRRLANNNQYEASLIIILPISGTLLFAAMVSFMALSCCSWGKSPDIQRTVTLTYFNLFPFQIKTRFNIQKNFWLIFIIRESVRDAGINISFEHNSKCWIAGDIWLSLLHRPPVTVSDTACTLSANLSMMNGLLTHLNN